MKAKMPKEKKNHSKDFDPALVFRVKIRPVRRLVGKNEFVARVHKNDLPSALDEWKNGIDWNAPDICVNIRGLTMPQQYSVAKHIKTIMSGDQLQKVTIDDGPYISSAGMIENYIKG